MVKSANDDSETSLSGGLLLIYKMKNEIPKIDMRSEGETVRLAQQHMAQLFQTTKQNIGQRLRSIFGEGALVQDSVVKDSLTTAVAGAACVYRWVTMNRYTKQLLIINKLVVAW